MADGGREALLDYLLGFDLSIVNLRQTPKTAALLDQKIASLPPEKGWLLDLLRNGRLPWGAECSANECPCDALFDSYVAHANRQGARRRSIETAIGSMLNKTFPKLRRGRATGALDDDRSYVYRFLPLAECRKRFDEVIQGNIDWGSPGSGFFDLDEWGKESPPDR